MSEHVEKKQKITSEMEHDAQFLGNLLTAIEKDIVPITQKAVLEGNKVFGACVLKKQNMQCVVADTNREIEWPLLHGEVSCLRSFQKIKDRPKSKDCLFIATHEPCSLCLSSITWSGFDNFYYLFTYYDTRDAFSIPHDLKMLDEVFDCPNGNYKRKNAYWQAFSITQLIADLPDGQDKTSLENRVTALRKTYDSMSSVYQDSKAENEIPLC